MEIANNGDKSYNLEGGETGRVRGFVWYIFYFSLTQIEALWIHLVFPLGKGSREGVLKAEEKLGGRLDEPSITLRRPVRFVTASLSRWPPL